MLPVWISQAFYIASAVLIAGLLGRMWLRNRRDRAEHERLTNLLAGRLPAAQAPLAKPAEEALIAGETIPQPVISPSALNAGSAPVTPAETALHSLASITPFNSVASVSSGAADATARPLYSVNPDPNAVPGWTQRSLFEPMVATSARVENLLPRILPEELPGVRTDDRYFGPATPALAAMLPESPERQRENRKLLHQAGHYTPHAAMNLSAARYVCMILPMLFFGAMLLFVPPAWELWVLAMVVIGPLLGWSLPLIYLRSQASERKLELERAMPDFLDMLNMCVSQGLTVPDSLKRIQSEMSSVYPALTDELRIVTEQTQLSSLDVALKNLMERVDVPEVSSFASLLMQTQRMGTSISDALVEYSDTMRESQKQRADEKGNQADLPHAVPDGAMPDARGLYVPDGPGGGGTVEILLPRWPRRLGPRPEHYSTREQQPPGRQPRPATLISNRTP